MYRQFMTAQEESGVDRAGPEYIRNQAAFIANRFRRQNPGRWKAMNNAPDAATALRIFRSTPGWEIGVVGNRFGYANQYESLMGFIPGETGQQEPQQVDTPDEVILPNEKEHKQAQTAKDVRDAHNKGELTPATARKLLRQVGDPIPDDLAPAGASIEVVNAARKKQGLPPLEVIKQSTPGAFHGRENDKDFTSKLDSWRDWVENLAAPTSGIEELTASGEKPRSLLGSPTDPFPINPKSGAVINTFKLAGDVVNSLMQGITSPDAVMSSGLFFIPGVAEAYALDVATHVPDQYREIRDRLHKDGMTWDNASRIAQTAVGDVLALLPIAGRTITLRRGKAEVGREKVGPTAAQEAAAAAAAEDRKPYAPTGPKTQAAAASGPGPTGTFVPPHVGVETGFVHYPEEGGFRVAPIPQEFARFQGEQPTVPQTPAKSAAGPVQLPTIRAQVPDVPLEVVEGTPAKPVAPPALYYDAQGNLVQHDGQVVQVAPSVKASVDPDGVANTHLAAAVGRGSLPDDILQNTKGGQTRADALAEGRDFINKGGDPRQVAERLQKLGGAARASRRELNGIHAEYDRLRQLVRQLDEDLQSRPDDQALRQRLKAAEDARDTFLRHIVPSTKTFASDVLKTFTGMHPVDAETFQGLMELLKERNGVAEVSDAARKALRSRAKGAKTLADRDTAAKGALHRAVDQAFPKVKSPSVEEMKAIVDQMATDLTPCK
jgi:hypothetical protein